MSYKGGMDWALLDFEWAYTRGGMGMYLPK